MPRLCEPDEFANALVILASSKAGYVNGATLIVEGGAVGCMPST
jgi:NAD(P)-dependent dehydrogenase (short-subunit alcohol dehydrogenase family)